MPYANIYVLSLVYLPLLWCLETVFLIKIDAWKYFMFRNEKFPGFELFYKLFEYFKNKGIDSNNTLWKRQNTNGFIKEQLFLSRGSKNCIPRTEKRKKVPVYEMLEFSWSLSSSMIPILSWKLKMHTEAALRFLHHLSWSCFVNTKWLPLSQRAPS